MSKDLTRVGQTRTALPALVLAAMTAAFLLVSVARAEDPPIVSVGQVGAAGNTASGQVGSEGKTDACVNDQSSEADPSADTGAIAKLNQGSCESTGGSGGSAESQTTGGQSTAGSGSKKPASARGTSGSAKSSTATASVAATNAVGLRIARVRHATKGVSATKHFRVLVTLKDLNGKLVRDALVTISKAPGARHTVSGMCATFSNKLGQAAVVVHVDNRVLGKRVFLRISARTPKARTITLRSVRLPSLKTDPARSGSNA